MSTPGPGKGWNVQGMGQRVHGFARTPTHKSWSMMKQRCYNPKAPDYPRYGGSGITVCEAWWSFVGFLSDMGERPTGTTLDRIDGRKGYTPENCRWATRGQQQRNRLCSLGEAGAVQVRWLCTDGGYTQKRVARAFGVHPSLVSRVLAGAYYAEGADTSAR